MKRSISIILVALLIISTSLLLVACGDGGVETEEQFNAALQALNDSKTTTIEITEKEYHNPLRTKREYSETIAYNSKQGMLKWYRDETVINVIGYHEAERHYYKFYIVEGSDLKVYSNSYVFDYDNGWTVTTFHLESHEAALENLHEIYLELIPNKLKFIEFYTYVNLHTNGKFEKKESDNYYDLTYQMQFSNGKLIKVSSNRELNSTNGGTALKQMLTIRYFGSVSKPRDLDNATEAQPQE